MIISLSFYNKSNKVYGKGINVDMKAILRETSIKKYLGLSLIAVVALPIIVLGAIGVVISSETLQRQIKAFDHTHVHHIQALIEQQLQRPVSGMNVISRLVTGADIAEGKELKHIQNGIQAIQGQHNHFARIQIADLQGNIVAIAPYDENLLGLDISGHDYFITAQNTDKLYWGASFLPEGSDVPLSTLSKRHDNYVITAYLTLNQLGIFKSISGNASKEFQPLDSKILTITDHEGTFIFHPDRSMVTTRAYDPNYLFDLHASSGEIMLRDITIDDIGYRASIVVLPETKWKIALYTPLSELEIPIIKLAFVIILITVVVTITASFFSVHISNRINDALSKLIIISDAIGKGEYEIPPQEQSPSQTKYTEFNQLASSFRFMATKVKDRENKIKEVQSYLSSIIDSMPSIIISVDKYLVITQWNIAAEEISNISADEAYGQKLVDVLPNIIMDTRLLQESIETKQVKYMRKKPLFGPESKTFQDITIFPLIAEEAGGAVIRIDDVTDKVMMEEMMVQSEKMLSIGGLAAGMAHEINNPLAGMMQTANVINNRLIDKLDLPANKKAAAEAGVSTEAIAKYMQIRDIPRMIQTIKDSGKHAAEVVANMLAFSRKSDHNKSTIAVGELIDKTLELAVTDYDMKKEYDFKQIKIEKELNADIPPLVCEQTKIQQVLLNLLRNSAQAMQESGAEKPTIIIRSNASPDGEKIQIEIEDNGPGMDEETSRRIFEPFYTTKDVGKGTGLGLSVSYFIVTENHGGKISVSSEKGIGTKFLISLPAKGRKDGA